MNDGKAREGAPEELSKLLLRLVRSGRSLLAVATDAEEKVVWANEAFRAAVGLAEAEISGTPLSRFLSEGSTSTLRRRALDGEDEPTRVSFLDRHGHPFTVETVAGGDGQGLVLVGEPSVEEAQSLSQELLRLNNELSTLARERARKEKEARRANERLQEALEELEHSYWHLRKIQEFLPVCMRCSRVKTAERGWKGLVDYLRDHEIFVSHGYCPDCANEVLEEEGF